VARDKDVFEQAQRAMAREQWTAALGALDRILSKSPNLVPVLFYKAVCHFRLEEWDAAEETTRKTLPLCAAQEHDQVREQLLLLLEQTPLARDAKALAQAQRAMAKEDWTEALGPLDKILSKSPNLVSALFYKAVCHFRLEEWDAAEETARKTLPLCATQEHDQVREQILLLLELIPMVRRRRVTQGAKGESRQTAGLWGAWLLLAGMISTALPRVVHPVWHGALTVIGILSLLIQRSDSIAPYWGGALIAIGLLTFILRRRARLLLTGVALLAASALNVFLGKLGGWTLLAVVQITLGISVLYQSRQGHQPDRAENRSRDTED
jgi:hypothetical protein